jgi:hypothetical protein
LWSSAPSAACAGKPCGLDFKRRGAQRFATVRRLCCGQAHAIRAQFAGRIVDVDGDVAELSGRLRAAAATQGAAADPIDALIAGCANARGATLATRNLRDFKAFGLTLIDPWSA